jgi:uncharacterized protein YfdQ (DUF2303 family)
MTDTQPIIDAATRAAGPTSIDDEGRFHTLVAPDGSFKLVDLEKIRDEAEFAHKPRRKEGTYKVHDAQSLVEYLAKHHDADTEVWADAVAAKIVGVLDAHEQTDGSIPGARHEQHRVEYSVLLTDAWKAWQTYDGKLLDQSTLAEHFEARSIDIVKPAAADMLELAQSFRATTSSSFESSKRLSDGQRQFEHRETIDAQAGKKGQLTIPEIFELGLKPFEGAEGFKVTARFRYRITDGVLRIGYKLDRPEDVLRQAFLTVVDNVEEGIAEKEIQLNSRIFRGSR